MPDILFHEEFSDSLMKSLKEEKTHQQKIRRNTFYSIEKNDLEAFSDKRRPDGKSSVHK